MNRFFLYFISVFFALELSTLHLEPKFQAWSDTTTTVRFDQRSNPLDEIAWDRQIRSIRTGDSVQFPDASWKIIRPLSEGGWGRAFVIQHEGKLRVLKIPFFKGLSDSGLGISAQVQQLRELRSRNLPAAEVHDFSPQRYYLVMDYADGGTFQERFTRAKTFREKEAELIKVLQFYQDLEKQDVVLGTHINLPVNIGFSTSENRYIVFDPDGINTRAYRGVPSNLFRHFVKIDPTFPSLDYVAVAALHRFKNQIESGELPATVSSAIDMELPLFSSQGKPDPTWVTLYTLYGDNFAEDNSSISNRLAEKVDWSTLDTAKVREIRNLLKGPEIEKLKSVDVDWDRSFEKKVIAILDHPLCNDQELLKIATRKMPYLMLKDTIGRPHWQARLNTLGEDPIIRVIDASRRMADFPAIDTLNELGLHPEATRFLVDKKSYSEAKKLSDLLSGGMTRADGTLDPIQVARYLTQPEVAKGSNLQLADYFKDRISKESSSFSIEEVQAIMKINRGSTITTEGTPFRKIEEVFGGKTRENMFKIALTASRETHQPMTKRIEAIQSALELLPTNRDPLENERYVLELLRDKNRSIRIAALRGASRNTAVSGDRSHTLQRATIKQELADLAQKGSVQERVLAIETFQRMSKKDFSLEAKNAAEVNLSHSDQRVRKAAAALYHELFQIDPPQKFFKGGVLKKIQHCVVEELNKGRSGRK